MEVVDRNTYVLPIPQHASSPSSSSSPPSSPPWPSLSPPRPQPQPHYFNNGPPQPLRYGGNNVPLRQQATEMAKSMDPGIYKAVTTGNINDLAQHLEDPEVSLLTQLTPQNNTILHIVAGLGHDRLIEPILRRCPDLFKIQNIAGDLALHLAASAGHLSTVQSLIANATLLYVNNTEEGREGGTIKDVVKMVNKELKTALHVALENHHIEVGKELFKANPQAAYCLNPKGISPLYLAAKRGYTELFRLMVENQRGTSESDRPGENYVYRESESDNDNDSDIFSDSFSDTPGESFVNGGQSLVHAAISGRNQEILDIVLGMSNWSELLLSTDEKGRTPLTYAACTGYVDGVRNILEKKSNETMYLRNKNGPYEYYPIHMAARQGHVEIIQEFLNCCPDSWELLDTQGRNILHVAANWGKANVVSYVLRTPHLEKLINQREKAGNTPLHLAVMAGHPKIVHMFTWDKRIKLQIVNNNGLTALDVAADGTRNLPLRQRYTLLALTSAGAPRSKNGSRRPPLPHPPYGQRLSTHESVNTLLLVSTLVATVTYVVGFTMPGGRNNSDTHHGMATFTKNLSFHAFLICNTIAMYSSIVAVATLVWAHLCDTDVVNFILKVASPLLGLSFTTMSIASITWVYLKVSDLNWLAIFVMVMGSLVLFALLVLFLPLFFPLFSNNWILRYIFYYPFHLLILATTSDAEGDGDVAGYTGYGNTGGMMGVNWIGPRR